jgi:hypothetical protein
MCNVYYLGSDSELPIFGSADANEFHVKELNSFEMAVRKNLPFKYVRYLGSHQGCGCGFRNESNSVPESDSARAAIQATHDALVAYLLSLPVPQRPMQIFNCWSGGEGLPPEYFNTYRIADLAQPDFAFSIPRELITLTPSPSRNEDSFTDAA